MTPLTAVQTDDQAWMDQQENERLRLENGGKAQLESAAIRKMFPRLDWEELWDQEDVGEDWILEPLLSVGRMTSMYSAPKTGKSLLMLEVAVAVSNGTECLGFTPPKPHHVVYVDFENDPRGDVKSRLKAMGYTPADLKNISFLSYPSFGGMDTEAGASLFLAVVQEYGGSVVIIDTISRAVAGKENENDTWLDFYRLTGLELKRLGIAVLRLDHSGKDVEKGQRGGSAKSGDVDAVWRLAACPGKGKDVFSLKCEAKRMMIDHDDLEITRQYAPLRHTVAGTSLQAEQGAALRDMLKLLDELNVPIGMGRDKVRKILTDAGHTANNGTLAAALKARKDDQNLSADRSGQDTIDLPVPTDPRTGSGQVDAETHNPSSEATKPVRENPRTDDGQSAAGYLSDLSPSTPSLRRGTGQAPTPAEPSYYDDLPDYTDDDAPPEDYR